MGATRGVSSMPDASVANIEEVGQGTVAIEFETPDGFEAAPGQFVSVRATVDGVEEAGYYTISSPHVSDVFEVTVAVDPEGALGPWLADRDVGDDVAIEGPFGDVRYTGDEPVVVLAEGPGIGPAVGVGERAREADRDVSIVYYGDRPPHRARLDALEGDGATLVVTDSFDDATDALESVTDHGVYVFGFEQFVKDAKEAVSDAGVDDENAHIESFGPK